MHLDDFVAQLSDPALSADPRLLATRLPLGGPVLRVSWRQPVAPDLAGAWTRCIQYWVPFPEDARTAVLTLSTLAAVLPPELEALLDGIAATLAFCDDDGTWVLPATEAAAPGSA
ncbi:MAG: hypothetical protein ACRDGL_11115 [Candidatus Limnocylindrales bacterium]